MKKLLILPLLVLMLLVGCSSEPKIDGSSDAALKKSIQTIMQGLKAPEQKKFEAAVKFLALRSIDIQGAMSKAFAGQQLPNEAETSAKMRKALDGKTAKEVIAEVQTIFDKQKAEQKKEDLLNSLN